ncbi:hypothetical protein HDF18_13120 [Mucilaginibacter sp. X5P1]|uniref:hypothetical protein n=1 Tax=Mucilaginibacter sp. X5P1 TaxID=2723088 RepID=UPI00160D2BCD|nr:hypothetical protein [Mucilaginibacter sp. X5P1]MBB6141718.1 hypothetical protein [Mucilaginibacter sp. X5P1]
MIDQTQPLTPQQSLLRLGTFVLVGLALDRILRGQKDTINYILYYRGRKVYHGICKAHRIEQRLNEHICQGKVFDEYDYDQPKVETEAKRIERLRIGRDQTKYNIHHR